jgi:aspartate carbamoyltransferase catalytic subunit
LASDASQWSGRDVINILDFSRPELEQLFEETETFVERPQSAARSLEGKVLATAFFEPSTRTRLSFTTAAIKLGARPIDLSPDASSLMKGESFSDTISMLESYSDLMVLRHPSEGAALLASELSSVPVINGGDGSQHHPTQAMLDLYTTRKIKGSIDGLNFALVGDTRYARTAASLLYALTKFKPSRVHVVSTETLRPRAEVLDKLGHLGLTIDFSDNLEEIIADVDVLYMTRIQKERFPDPADYEKVKGNFRLNPEMLAEAKKDCVVLHPLPRTGELPHEIDSLPSAAYMRQVGWGVPLRMALLKLILGSGAR